MFEWDIGVRMNGTFRFRTVINAMHVFMSYAIKRFSYLFVLNENPIFIGEIFKLLVGCT